MAGLASVVLCLALPCLAAASPFSDSDDFDGSGGSVALITSSHPHPPCCGAGGSKHNPPLLVIFRFFLTNLWVDAAKPPAGKPSCPTGPCTACRTPGAGACCPCLPEFPPLPACASPETCLQLSSARGYGVGEHTSNTLVYAFVSVFDRLLVDTGLGMLDALVYAGGFKGNANLDAIDVYNTTTKAWSHYKMSVGRTLFDGAALGRTAIFGCGEGGGGGTADIFDVITGKVTTVSFNQASGFMEQVDKLSLTIRKTTVFYASFRPFWFLD